MQKGWLSTVAAAAILGSVVILGSSTAFAQQNCANLAAEQCSASCGSAGVNSCTRTGSAVSCVCNEQTKDVNGNAFGTATQTGETGQGNLSEGGGGPTPSPCTGNQGQCKKQ
jgi:hypothetical protein